ncbi:hypothetical protein A2716_01205 [candidate division WWE3 bacterium RIFCSPHIGHO2_01_FULL_40_23]|uniref:Glycosyltransferase RgtA/B/C/D-like domain-containing protein n=1 Tax=candidate division WWE3 bacterium RIFCSPLOWO2_01_FULL_41_18 TaxID=1802625 RepID=A0A1F4VDW6_UNCKA|nr:MAG: hypothetical protein A2716_01205 [candidate division WWE3 bacterium RIFCSPHIGHO2_01_FULL_40_23]OGC55354.1 MAG: hypothetical protein A3A78_00110 [candidate division WWE3 bacterium RIFCSPLOWO2_01_FULL_41_18]
MKPVPSTSAVIFSLSDTRKNLIIILLLLFLFLSLRLTLLGEDISNSDAARWHIRSDSFLNALLNKDYQKTYQHNQPGVTLMWIGALDEILFHEDLISKQSFLSDSDNYLNVHKSSKRMLVLVLSGLFLSQVILLKTLINAKVSYMYGLFMSLEPYVVGIDRLFHVTSLESYLLFTSFLLMWSWFKTNKKVHCFISGILFSLAFLSKTTVLVMLPLFALMFFIKFRKRKSFDFALFLIPAAFFTVLLFPAFWVNPGFVYEKLFSGISNAISSDIRAESFLGLFSFFYYPTIYLFKVSPLMFLLTALTIFNLRKKENLKPIFLILFYCLLYYIPLSISVKKIDRYLIPVFPAVFLLVSIFLDSVNVKLQKITVGIYLLASFLITYLYIPVYSAYYSPLFGSSNGALRFNIYTNSGQYFAQAALYANQNLKGKEIFVPYNKESYYYLYKEKSNMRDKLEKTTDFTVLSFNKLSSEKKLQKKCPVVGAKFGSKLEGIVLILNCQSTKTTP